VTAVLVFLGAAVGAPLRYVTDRLVQSRHGGAFPWGTLAVNVAGSLVLGALAGAGSAVPHGVLGLVGVGFCGALTTYSTFGYDTVRLAEEKSYGHAVLNVVATLVAGLGAAFAAYAVTSALLG
jgi:CrcB protein